MEFVDAGAPAKAVEHFQGTCKACGSNKVAIEFEFNYYGGMTGWDQRIEIVCNDCDLREGLYYG